MPNIKIIVDTSSDMPKEISEKYNIEILSFLSIFGDKSYISGVDITNKEFYDMMVNSDVIPTTSQVPYQDIYDCLLESSKNYDSVIFFTISSKGSGEYSTAMMIKNEIQSENPNADIHIVDSMKYSLYITAAAVKASQLAQEGYSVEHIITECIKELESWDVMLLVDNLKYLEKGGRINKATAIVGSLLDIKPVLSIKDGLIENTDKMRGKKKILEKLINLMKDSPNFNSISPEFMIVQSDEEKGNTLSELLKDEFGDDTVKIHSEFGPIIGTHTGPGSVAVIYKIKN